jgi:CTD kinase subunit gamma CTK3
MADPFEVRMRFTTQLQHLSASVTSSQKAAHYALKYRDMDEDLHSCILEQLEKVQSIHVMLATSGTCLLTAA